MNTEFKQWKKLWASKQFLIFFGVVGTFLSYVVTLLGSNFLLYFGLNALSSLTETKRSGTLIWKQEGNVTDSLSFFPKLLNGWHALILIGIFCFLIYRLGMLMYKMRRSYEDINKGSKGTQEWTSIEDIKKQYPRAKMDDKEFDGKSGIPICAHEGYIYFDDNNTNSETLGSSQSGKTQGFTYPTMDLGMRAKEKDSFLVFDVKGNMLRNTKEEWERFGFLVLCLNLIDPDNGFSYNPLELIRQAYIQQDFGKAQMLAQTFSYSIYNEPNSKDKFWQDTSIALLNALILAVCDIAIQNKRMEYVTLYSVVMMLITLTSTPDESGKTELDLYFENLPADNPARMQFSMIEKATGVTRSGIYTSMQSKLAIFMNDKVARMTSQNTIDLADIAYGEKPVALFMVVPDYDESTYSIVSTFITQLNYVLAEKATSSATSKLPRRLRRLFEEIANVPPIEGLSRSMNVNLERGILTHIVVQSEAQLEDKYGDKMAKAITGACGNKIYIMSDNSDDAKEFSGLLGSKTIIAPNRHGDPLSLDKSFGENEDGRELLDFNEMRMLEEGEWVVIRTKRRRDLKGNSIKPRPIFANREEGTNMPFAYQYLGDRFNSNRPLSEYNLGGGHKNLNLKELIIPFKTQHIESNEVVEEEEVIHYQASPEVPENYEFGYKFEQENTEGVSEVSVNAISIKQTPIIEVITETKQKVMYQIARKNLSPEEYAYFEELNSLEEIKDFLDSPRRIELKNAFSSFVFN